MEVLPFRSPRGCRSYLLVDGTEAALVDPSDEVADDAYLAALAERHAKLRYLIETHTHADHRSSSARLRAATGASLVRHASAPSPLKDIPVQGGESLPLGTAALHLLATPGHTDESISVLAEESLFTGDALLIGGTGRTDFQQGDSAALYASLHDVLGSLPDETTVYPAHEYQERTSSTIGAERAGNPRFLLPREEFIAAMDAHHPPVPELFEESIAANSA